MKRNNFKALLAVTVLTLSSVLAYTPAGSVSAKTVLSKKKLTMKVSEQFLLKLKGAKGKVTWKSEKTKVAKVSKKGKVTALKKGKSTITASNAGKKYKCSVIVQNNTQKELTTPVNTPVPAEPTPTQKHGDGGYRLQLTHYMQYLNYKVTNIEDEYISIERTNNTEVEYKYYTSMNDKERLRVDKEVLVFSNGEVIPSEEGAFYFEDLIGRYIEGDRMNYLDIKIGDIVDILYLENFACSDSSRMSFGCRVINVKR